MLTAHLPTIYQKDISNNPCADRPHEATVPGLHDLEEGLPVEEVHRRACAARKSLARAQRAISFCLPP
jgi:hypothetical protein